MSIHQVQLRYDPVADRLLLSLRTHQAQLYRVWLTRRMIAGLAGPLQEIVARFTLPQGPGAALPVPEARPLMAEVARERPLNDLSFGEPFASDAQDSHPLGPEPLLPAEIDLRTPPGGGLQMALREFRGRRLELSLSADLATGLARLLDQCLGQANWSLPAAAQVAAAATGTYTLN